LDFYYSGNKIFNTKEEFENTKRRNHNTSMEEQQTTQWPEKSSKGQPSTKYNIIHL
jgi:hypothetical protein